MKVLIGCEYSGTVRRAFAALGHEAWSCDLLPAQDRHNMHLQGDVREFIGPEWGWDLLMVAHPPCTRLCASGVRWLSEAPGKLDASTYTAAEIAAYRDMNAAERLAFMWAKLDEGAALFSDLYHAPIERVAIENPVMHGHAKAKLRDVPEFSQSVQPYQFGHRETKRTCLWLRGLPLLTHTTPELAAEYKTLTPEERNKWARVHNASPGAGRWAERSKFFDGIAAAMASQWGGAEFVQSLAKAA